MRSFFVILLASCAVWPALGQSAPKAEVPYHIDFDSSRDVSTQDKDAVTGKSGLFVTVRFNITLDGAKVARTGSDYRIVIEEDGHRVWEKPVPKPTASDELSVVLAIDTSGSMKEFGRIAQARKAAGVFLGKLPARADCGLILFDHEMRPPVIAPTLDRKILLDEIGKVEPRGGTAYLDAVAKGIGMLKASRKHNDRALVIMTDGVDLNSSASLERVVADAKQNQVRVYTIGIGEPGRMNPVNSVLVLDHSGSMQSPADDADTTSKINALHAAAARFVSIMPSTGRTTLIPFNSGVGTPKPFSNNKFALTRDIQALQPVGETALFDATYAAIATLEASGTRGKRAVVAMTDGVDNSSRRRVEEVIARAREAKIALHMLGFGRKGELDEKAMMAMAEQTGGKYYHARNEKSLLEIFENLSIQLHDDGIDEATLTKLAQQTGGDYYPAKNVQDLQFILEKVTQSIQKKEYSVTFASARPVADGTARNVTLKLVRRGGEVVSNEAGVNYVPGEQVVQVQKARYQTHGVVVAEMNPLVYLLFLVIIAGLIAAPSILRKRPAM